MSYYGRSSRAVFAAERNGCSPGSAAQIALIGIWFSSSERFGLFLQLVPRTKTESGAQRGFLFPGKPASLLVWCWGGGRGV